MLAAFCSGKEEIEVRQTDAPEPRRGEVLVRVKACGICGSDLHLYRGTFPALPGVPPGHEFSGEVAACGDGVSGWAPGDRVAVEPIGSCQACEYCRSGRRHLCAKRELLGMSARGGGLAEYVSVPDYTLYRLPESVDFEVGALAEPLAVAVHGMHIVGLRAGEKALVLGSGTIGLMAVLAAKHAGASVMATYRYDHQAEAALALGASRAVRDGETAGLERERFDVVIETVGGAAPTLAQAVNVVRPGGRVSVLGLFAGAAPVNALGLVLKEAAVVGGITYCRPGLHSDFDVALAILAERGEAARALITHRFPLAEAAGAFAAAADKHTNSLKVQVQM